MRKLVLGSVVVVVAVVTGTACGMRSLHAAGCATRIGVEIKGIDGPLTGSWNCGGPIQSA